MPGDDQETEISHQTEGQAQDPEEGYLKDLFDKEMASDRRKKRNRILVTLFISCFVVLLILGFLSGSSPSSYAGGPDTTQAGPTPAGFPDTTQPVVSPPVSGTPEPPTTDMSPGINGKANPGFPYWTSGALSYRFDTAKPCMAARTSNILRAMKIIGDKTDGLVSFFQSPDGKMVIGCRDVLASPGESAWTSLGIDPGGSIQDAGIDFLTLPAGTSECDSYPSLELHEIFHALGFEDNPAGSNVMNPGTAGSDGSPCREMDLSMVNCLKNIYSNGHKGQSCTGIPHS